jgi:mono/diheme cytochrome c family protein
MSLGLVIGGNLVVLGVVLFALSQRIRRRWPGAYAYLSLVMTATITIGVFLVAINVAGGQTPMSRTPNPVADQVTSVDAGYRLYQANCAACHGVDGTGGGPLAGTTSVIPPSLKAHLTQHTDGDLFYWISNGLPGGMPAWAAKLSETDRWNLVNFLRSINGQGPPADVTPGASGAAQGVVLVLPVGFALFFGGWLGAGLRGPASRR